MTIDDILEVETLQYCYEQAYPLHRHDKMPDLFFRSDETIFTIPSADDFIKGFEKIKSKFTDELFYVSEREDSYHTGWQITTPLIWEDREHSVIKGLFPTFGYFVVNLVTEMFHPPYRVNATSEMWINQFCQTDEGWRILRLQAEFLMGQPVWEWNAQNDDTFATRKELRRIPHPYL